MRRKIILVLAVMLVAVFGSALIANAEEAAPKPKPADVGDKVPNFELPGLDGANLSFDKDIKGKNDAAFLIFMTSACSACQAEVSAVNDIKVKYKDKVGIYAIMVDIRGIDTVKPYTVTYKYDATYLLDPKFTVPRLFGFNYTPSILLIDKDGKIVFKKGGYTPGDEEMLQDKVVGMVKAKK